MNKIYEDAVDLNVVARLVYKKTNDAYAYADSAKTVKIDAATLVDVFTKGMLIVDGVNRYIPTALAVVNGVATVTYVTANAGTATTAVLATLASKEYVAA